jgi:hypothetical protein
MGLSQWTEKVAWGSTLKIDDTRNRDLKLSLPRKCLHIQLRSLLEWEFLFLSFRKSRRPQSLDACHLRTPAVLRRPPSSLTPHSGPRLPQNFYHHVKYQALTTFKRVSEDWNGRRYSSFS